MSNPSFEFSIEFKQRFHKHHHYFRKYEIDDLVDFYSDHDTSNLFDIFDAYEISEIYEIMCNEKYVGYLNDFQQKIVRTARAHLKRYGALTWKQWVYVQKLIEIFVHFDLSNERVSLKTVKN